MTEPNEEFECLGDACENQFDTIIGLIEDIIIESEFIELQKTFLEKYHKEFEPCEENKLEYMDIFNAYTELIEKYIEASLLARFPEFSMKKFLQDLKENHSELEGEVFDILVKEGKIPDLSLNNVSHHKT
ncbi:ADP-ribosylation factor-like protein 2-binding protein isoform X2 [Uloborus diversus]|uniref:ADP-ribosylation factor-like protein 2-binding protein isoform X2 n=1 Tax=Uloborus diversus TaxID=327109 RepID=UPI0024093227|nr:ADP-ribosylation factor-like protein 2-binding protein isoform X2 [Uloborus diversus]